MAEDWRDIQGLGGRYEVSSEGRIRRVKTGRIRKLTMGPTGYYQAGFWVGDTSITQKVHKLVAAAFIGPRPAGADIMHKDGDKLNNRAQNLAYGTRSDNTMDQVRHGRHNNARKTHCKRGHEFTEENTYRAPSKLAKYRECRACRKERD